MKDLFLSCALALACATALGGAASGPSVDPPPGGASSAGESARPVIILVHGRGQLPGDSAVVRAEWSRVLRAATAQFAGADLLRDDDVWLAWYADALDPLTPPICAVTDSSLSQRSGAAEDQSLRAVFAAVGEGLAEVIDVFDGYARDEVRTLAGDLLFLGDPVRRCSAESQLASSLARAVKQGRRAIVVAHSFGSLLSYGYLTSAARVDSAGPAIEHFVTMGSLLGAPGARQLLLGDTSSRAVLPVGVRAWTNIVDERDGLSHRIEFAMDSLAGPVENLTTTSGAPGADPHDALRYLRDPVTVRTIMRAWCGAIDVALREARSPPCESVAAR